jgi:hypothetical protein
MILIIILFVGDKKAEFKLLKEERGMKNGSN